MKFRGSLMVAPNYCLCIFPMICMFFMFDRTLNKPEVPAPVLSNSSLWLISSTSQPDPAFNSRIHSSIHYSFIKATRVRPQPWKLLIFSRFSKLKVAWWLLSDLTKLPKSARDAMIYRIQNQYLWSLILKLSQ